MNKNIVSEGRASVAQWMWTQWKQMFDTDAELLSLDIPMEALAKMKSMIDEKISKLSTRLIFPSTALFETILNQHFNPVPQLHGFGSPLPSSANSSAFTSPTFAPAAHKPSAPQLPSFEDYTKSDLTRDIRAYCQRKHPKEYLANLVDTQTSLTLIQVLWKIVKPKIEASKAVFKHKNANKSMKDHFPTIEAFEEYVWSHHCTQRERLTLEMNTDLIDQLTTVGRRLGHIPLSFAQNIRAFIDDKSDMNYWSDFMFMLEGADS